MTEFLFHVVSLHSCSLGITPSVSVTCSPRYIKRTPAELPFPSSTISRAVRERKRPKISKVNK